jgi:hypothetical protein
LKEVIWHQFLRGINSDDEIFDCFILAERRALLSIDEDIVIEVPMNGAVYIVQRIFIEIIGGG